MLAAVRPRRAAARPASSRRAAVGALGRASCRVRQVADLFLVTMAASHGLVSLGIVC